MGQCDATSPIESNGDASDDVAVYLVEDHDIVRATLIRMIDAAPGLKVIGSAATARRALADIPRVAPDVVLLDGNLPDGDGLEVCRTLRQIAPEVDCVILTAGTNIPWGPREAAQAGAAGFLVKKLSDFPLVETIRSVANRRRPR